MSVRSYPLCVRFKVCIFWQHLATFGNFWQLLATFGQFWQLLKTFDNFWHVLATFGQFWQLLATFRYFSLLFATFGNLWQLGNIVNRLAGRTSRTDQLDGPARQTSWMDHFFLASLHIQRLTSQFVHCRSFRVLRSPCLHMFRKLGTVN